MATDWLQIVYDCLLHAKRGRACRKSRVRLRRHVRRGCLIFRFFACATIPERPTPISVGVGHLGYMCVHIVERDIADVGDLLLAIDTETLRMKPPVRLHVAMEANSVGAGGWTKMEGVVFLCIDYKGRRRGRLPDVAKMYRLCACG